MAAASLLELGARLEPAHEQAALLAVGSYLRIFSGWAPEPVLTPTLLVRARQPLGRMPADDRWRVTWSLPHEEVEVPGDHFSMFKEHANSTAAAVRDWIRDTRRSLRGPVMA